MHQDIPDPSELEASPDDPEYPDMIAVMLPRSNWLYITTMYIRSLLKDVRQVQQEEWKENSELREMTRPGVLRLLPVLMEAIGPGPSDGPAIQDLQPLVDSIWEEFGGKPSEEDRELAEQVVMNLFQRLRDKGVDPDVIQDLEPDDIPL